MVIKMIKKNISNKGNVTIFIVLGIVFLILISISAYFLYNYYSMQNVIVRTVEQDIEGFEQSIENCYYTKVPEQVLIVNFQSGRSNRIDALGDGLIYGDIEISKYLRCYYDNNIKKFASVIPSKQDLEFELSRAIEDSLDSCFLESIINYRNILNINYTYASVNTIIDDKKVSFNIDPNIVINYESNNNQYSHSLSQFNIHQKVDDNRYLNVTNYLIQDIIDNDGQLDLTIMPKYNISINITAFPEEVYLFDLYDNYSVAEAQKTLYECHYLFAIDLNCIR